MPRAASRHSEQAVRFFVVFHLFVDRVPLQLAPENKRDITQDAERRDAVPGLDGHDWIFARLDAFEPIEEMADILVNVNPVGGRLIVHGFFFGPAAAVAACDNQRAFVAPILGAKRSIEQFLARLTPGHRPIGILEFVFHFHFVDLLPAFLIENYFM